MTITQLTNEALALPLPQRIELAQRLWQSVNEQSNPDLDPEEEAILAEAERRDDELDRGLVKPLSHEEVMAAARKAIQCD